MEVEMLHKLVSKPENASRKSCKTGRLSACATGAKEILKSNKSISKTAEGWLYSYPRHFELSFGIFQPHISSRPQQWQNKKQVAGMRPRGRHFLQNIQYINTMDDHGCIIFQTHVHDETVINTLWIYACTPPDSLHCLRTIHNLKGSRR